MSDTLREQLQENTRKLHETHRNHDAGYIDGYAFRKQINDMEASRKNIAKQLEQYIINEYAKKEQNVEQKHQEVQEQDKKIREQKKPKKIKNTYANLLMEGLMHGAYDTEDKIIDYVMQYKSKKGQEKIREQLRAIVSQIQNTDGMFAFDETRYLVYEK